MPKTVIFVAKQRVIHRERTTMGKSERENTRTQACGRQHETAAAERVRRREREV